MESYHTSYLCDMCVGRLKAVVAGRPHVLRWKHRSLIFFRSFLSFCRGHNCSSIIAIDYVEFPLVWRIRCAFYDHCFFGLFLADLLLFFGADFVLDIFNSFDLVLLEKLKTKMSRRLLQWNTLYVCFTASSDPLSKRKRIYVFFFWSFNLWFLEWDIKRLNKETEKKKIDFRSHRRVL